MTETDESCSSIVKLEIQGLDASSDNVTINDGVKSCTALIHVDQLITTTTLIATYNDGITRRSAVINFIGTAVI